MARADVTTQTITAAGGTVTLTAPPADGDIVDLDGILTVVAGATPTTVTIVTPGTVEDLAIAEGTVAVAASTRVEIPIRRRSYRQPVDAAEGAGRVLVNYSSVATITRGFWKG